jgi:hypothetical protein
MRPQSDDDFPERHVSFLPTIPADKVENSITVKDRRGREASNMYRRSESKPSSMVSSGVKETVVKCQGNWKIKDRLYPSHGWRLLWESESAGKERSDL